MKFRAFLITLFLLCLCTLPATAAQKRALLVGISTYPHYTQASASWNPIHGTTDAQATARSLRRQHYQVTTLLGAQATAARIRKALRQLTAQARRGDYIFIQFAGHGQPFEDLDGDEDDGWDESFVPYDAQKLYRKGIYEGANHITDDELYTHLVRLRRAVGTSGLVCVVVDACHAGGFSRGENEADQDTLIVRGTRTGFSPHGRPYHPRINARGNFRIPTIKGAAPIIILEACRAYQSNCEIRQAGRYCGPLSYYLNQVIITTPITPSLNWVRRVITLMNADLRLSNQNPVLESTLTK